MKRAGYHCNDAKAHENIVFELQAAGSRVQRWSFVQGSCLSITDTRVTRIGFFCLAGDPSILRTLCYGLNYWKLDLTACMSATTVV